MSPASITDRGLTGATNRRPRNRWGWTKTALVGVCAAFLASCYTGGEREKEAPPGYPGGQCVDRGQPTCEDPAWVCVDGGFCMDTSDPCNGVFCGGFGSCFLNDQQLPYCDCDDGYNNERYTLYCEPDSGALPEM